MAAVSGEWTGQALNEFAPDCAARRCDDCRAEDCVCACHLPKPAARRDWHCACGGRLSYGVYCKSCETEVNFAIRQTTNLDRLIAWCQTMPAPPYPWRADDLNW